MPLLPPGYYTEPESILTFGVNSAGKTRGWAAIRKWFEITQSPGHFHVLSTEYRHAMRTRQAYLDGTPGNNFDSNATIYETTDYDSLMEASELVRKAGLATSIDTPEGPRSPDWVIIDSVGHPKIWARDKWFGINKGMTWREFLDSGRGVKEVKPNEWGQMAGLYRDWIIPNIYTFPGNKYATAHLKEIRTEGLYAEKNRDILRMFGPHGVKPDGDDDLGHSFNTVLLLNRARDGWQITTVDDPEREYLTEAPVVDMVMSYLQPVAGWSIS